jgi:ribosomal protein L34
VRVYAPPPGGKPEAALQPSGRDSRRYKRAREPQAVQDWRARMQTAEGQAIFRRRKLIERLHAHYKNRGLGRLTVRGLAKTQAAVLWHALANNLMVAHRLRAAASAA